MERLDIEEAERSVIRSAVKDFLRQSGIIKYFHPSAGRKVLNEQELAGAGGALYRADRIVINDGAVTVIDYKTGGDEHAADHIAQVKRYMGILRDIHPEKAVYGVVAYVDLKQARVVQ